MKTLTHRFVECMPDTLEDAVVYVSIPFALVSHKCCCGCGEEVVTPLSPTDWELIFDGETVSLYPSIGNWNFKCRSHYWITRDCVEWAPQWSDAEIMEGRRRNSGARKRYFESRSREKSPEPDRPQEAPAIEPKKKSIVSRLKRKGR
jgi:hypothetical protein